MAERHPAPAAPKAVSGPAPVSARARPPDIEYVPTEPEVVLAMLDLAEVGPGDVVYDLGCGDGRIVIAAAERGARGVGIDIDPARIAESRANALRAGVSERVTFREGDIFTEGLADATVVMLYLLPELNVRLVPQLARLPAGTRIVSHRFDMRGIEPDAVVPVALEPDPMRPPAPPKNLYLFTTPLRMTP